MGKSWISRKGVILRKVGVDLEKGEGVYDTLYQLWFETISIKNSVWQIKCYVLLIPFYLYVTYRLQ